jgi:primary-amine oxidase
MRLPLCRQLGPTVLLLAGITSAPLSALAQVPGCIPASPAPTDLEPDEVYQEFARNGQPTTAWRVRWAAIRKWGLIVADARFRRAPGEPWIQVLAEARLAEMFVPYHSGDPRFADVVGFNFPLIEATATDAGTCGMLLGSPPRVIKEVRERGIAWKDDQAVHRGQELALWATLDAANYNYLLQYRFQDDGVVAVEAAATSQNLPGAQLEGHMHTAIWRLDVDLAGHLDDRVLTVRHIELPAQQGAANDEVVPFNAGLEGSLDRAGPEFTSLRIEDSVVQNANGKPVGYDLLPLTVGVGRHWRPGEEFVQHDFWVTRFREGELTAQLLPTDYVSGESVMNEDVVVWASTPIHHDPHDEDGRFEAGGRWAGVALARWAGIQLRPHNLFATTPFYP